MSRQYDRAPFRPAAAETPEEREELLALAIVVQQGFADQARRRRRARLDPDEVELLDQQSDGRTLRHRQAQL
jgi:hypothetical protein